MKARDTRPGGVALDAASRKSTTPGVTPRPPTVDDDATVPRRILELPQGHGSVAEPLASEPLLGAALRESFGSMGDTAPSSHAPSDQRYPGQKPAFGDTTPDAPRKEMPSASELLAATPFGPSNDDALEDLAKIAKATPMIPERADSDGARNARFATEGVPARAAKVTMPTGEVLLEPGEEDGADPPSVEADPVMTVAPIRRRAALPTAPSGRVLELEDDRQYRKEGVRGIVAGVSIALALLAALLIGILVFTWDRKPAVEPSAAGGTPSAPHVPVTAATPTPTAKVVSPIPPGTEPLIGTAAPKSSHGGPSHAGKPLPSAGSVPIVTAPTPPPVNPPVPPPVPPTVAPPVPTDITHNIN